MDRVLNCSSPAVISHPAHRVCAGTEVACSQVHDSIAATVRGLPEIHPWAEKAYLGAVAYEESRHFSPYLTQEGGKTFGVFQLALGSLFPSPWHACLPGEHHQTA